MPEPEIDANSTHEILKELRTFTKEIRDLLLQKAGQENGTTQQTNGASHQGEEGSSEVPDATAHQPLNTETANVETDNPDNWPNNETMEKYRNRCAKHKSECEKMQVELGCFIAHLGIVGGNQRAIDNAELLRKGLLDPVQCLEKAYDVTPDVRLGAMDKVLNSVDRLDDFVRDFSESPHPKDALYLDKVKQWWNFTCNGWSKIDVLVYDSRFVECLEFIHDVFFSELETLMGCVVEALTTFEEKSASEWLATQKIEDSEKRCEEYISRVFPLFSDRDTNGCSDADLYAQLKAGCGKHRVACKKMWIELDHLIAHFDVVGGDGEVIKSAILVQKHLLGPVERLEAIANSNPDERLRGLKILKSMHSIFAKSNIGRPIF